ncbi:uncharacterized protein LOC116851310 [Odontomachus brunneus]|uniref:uncharacterized protein LOC116851310 n=1 Tax=Odontomachus brunneus TaxID=486640 RepID=UPI0013F1B133|nr:uncharacterized protein LOC116851310 [Odontomachus brunneus]
MTTGSFHMEVLGIIEVWPNSFEVLDCIPVLLYGVIPMIKAICLVYTLPKLQIKILLTKIKDHWIAPKLDEETKILRSYAIYGENFGHLYTYFYLGHSVLFLSVTLLSKFLSVQSSEESDALNEVQGAQKGMPYRVNYIVDLNTYYVPIFLHTATCEVYYLLLIVCQDVLYMTLVQHCCGLLAALR